MPSSDLSHPLFARLFDRFITIMEPEVGRYRSELLAGMSGRVLEVGAGNGMNFGHYGEGIEEVVAVEPEPYLRQKATEAAAKAVPEVTVIGGRADSLPFDDDSFDHVVACMVLCSIEDPVDSLREAGRVLRPTGQLHFFEHVASSRPAKARFQGFLDRSGIWPGIAGGCHCGRDTVGSIAAAGFEVIEVEEVTIGPRWGHTNPHVIGCARTHTSP